MTREVWARRTNLLSALLVIPAPLVAYAWCIRSTYAWSDDYPHLASALGIGPSATPSIVAGYRPLYAAVLDGLFSAAGQIDALRVLRLFGFCGAICLGLLLQRQLRRSGAKAWVAALTASLVLLLPAFHGFAGWASTAPYPWAATVAGIGSASLVSSRRRTWLPAALAVALATLVYQPAAMFFWVPLGAWLAFERPPWRSAWATTRVHLVVAGLGLAAALVVGRATMAVLDIEASTRANLLDPGEVPEKVTWLLTRLVVTAARPFAVDSPEPLEAAATALPVLLVIVGGLVVSLRGRDDRFRVLALLALLVPLAVLPNLLVSENQFDFRIMVALAPLTIVYLVAAGEAILSVRAVPSFVLPVGLALVVAVATWRASAEVDLLFVRQGTAARELFRTAAAAAPEDVERVAVRMPERGWGARDGLGIYSTVSDLQQPWVPAPLVQLVFRERGRALTQHDVTVTRTAAGARYAFTIDARPLLRRLAD